MKLQVKKDYIFVIFFICFVSVLLYLFLNQIIHGYEKESWQITEWLINYQGGFVRRGLWGEIILNLYSYFGLNPYTFILVLSGACYLIFLAFFIKLFIKKGYPLFVLPFVFFLGGPIINNFWVRKDILIILIFSLLMYLSEKKSNIKIILINLVFIIGLLTHESIGFFCFPILFLMFFNANSTKTANNRFVSIVTSLVQLSPSLLVFFLALYYKGSLVVSNIIWGSWRRVVFPIQNINFSGLPTAIDGLSWSLKQGFEYTFKYFSGFSTIYIPIVWFFILILVYYVLTNLDKINIEKLGYKANNKFNKTNISNVLIFQFLSILPLFFLGADYGRWIFLWVLSSFSIILLFSEEKISTIFPKFVTKISFKINIILNSIFSRYKNVVFFIIFFLGIPVCSYQLNEYLYFSPYGIILRMIFKSVELLGLGTVL